MKQFMYLILAVSTFLSSIYGSLYAGYKAGKASVKDTPRIIEGCPPTEEDKKTISS